MGNLISSFVLFRKSGINLNILNQSLSNETFVKVKDYSKCGINDVLSSDEQITKPDVKTVIKFEIILSYY